MYGPDRIKTMMAFGEIFIAIGVVGVLWCLVLLLK
jgi:hypothetical protein